MNRLAQLQRKASQDRMSLDAIAQWVCDEGSIRITSEGQPSVFDMIRVLGGQKSPQTVWLRLKESHPEVTTKCSYLQFPGPGQRETPVAKTKKDAYYILGLLPGAVGRRYRENAANLFVRFLDDPAGLASELVERLNQEERDWLEARLRGLDARRDFTAVLKEFGVVQAGYAHCTNAIYIPMLGTDARGFKHQISEQKNLPIKAINPRDHMTATQLRDIETAERVAEGQLRRQSIAGNTGVERVVRKSAEYTRQLLNGEITIPSLDNGKSFL